MDTMMNHFYDAVPRGVIPPIADPFLPSGPVPRVFPGYPVYLDRAAESLGLGGMEAKRARDLARAQPAMCRVASCVSQALNIKDKAEARRRVGELINGLRTALTSAEMMAAELDEPADDPATQGDELSPAGFESPPLGGRPAGDNPPAKRGPGRPRKDG